MIRRQWLRRLLAPAVGFRKPSLLLLAGLIAFVLGAAISFRDQVPTFVDFIARGTNNLLRPFIGNDALDKGRHLLGGVLLLAGIYLLVQGVRSGMRIVFAVLNPEAKDGLGKHYSRRLQLAQGPRIVALGGGTGLSTLLRGLKTHSSNITAIVTVTDDGGSSGRLSQEFGMIPPGDIRNCLVALADAEKSMTDLFQHRFSGDSGSLSGHSLGNLLIAALTNQARGDFERAIEIASDVLAIRGRVIPSTLDHVRLKALIEDGTELCGETTIVGSGQRIRRIFLDPEAVEAHPEAVAAIMEADLICIGPGSVYTSVVPNLLVPGIAEALEKSEAMKAYICNVMTQKGESDSFTASEHVTAIRANVDRRIFDYVIVNTGIPTASTLEKYRGAGQLLVDPDMDRIRAMGYRVLAGDFMNETDMVRHDPMRIAARLVALVDRR
jgi:uncharacterized cofD-like protein